MKDDCPESTHGKYVFGYFPRNKYNDLVFYVKTGEHSNCGLFEVEDTEGNRALLDALLLGPTNGQDAGVCPSCQKREDEEGGA